MSLDGSDGQQPAPENDEEKGNTRSNEMEVYKGIFSMILWDIICIVSVWSRGLVLSIAAALVGVQLGAVVRFITSDDQASQIIAVIAMGNTAIIGGLIIAAASSAVKYSGIATFVTVLASLQGAYGACLLAAWSSDGFQEVLKETLVKQKIIEKQAAAESGIDLKVRKASPVKKEETAMATHPWQWVAQLAIIITGTALSPDEMAAKLSLLGVALVLNLQHLQILAAKEERFNSKPLYETIFFIGKLAAEIIPIGYELSIEEDKDNPNVLTFMAWASFLLCVAAKVAWYYAVTDEVQKQIEKTNSIRAEEERRSGGAAHAHAHLVHGTDAGAMNC